MSDGWVCPKCGAVYAPYMSECYRCNNVAGSGTQTQSIITTGDTRKLCPKCGVLPEDHDPNTGCGGAYRLDRFMP